MESSSQLQHLEGAAAAANLPGAIAKANLSKSLVRFERGLWPLVIVLLASSVITVAFWRLIPEQFRLNEQSDYASSYEPAARSLLAGHGPTVGGELVTGYPPGYPLILAGIFGVSHWLGVPEETSLSAFAVICMALASMFIFVLARMFWGVRPALISALLWMTYPFALWLTKQPNSELPFMVIFYGGLCLFWYALARRLSARVYFLCGLVFGVAMLVRPIAMGIGLVAAAVVWFVPRELNRRVRAALIAMLLLGNLSAVLPWEAWAYHKTGQVIPLSTNGVRSMRDGMTFAVVSKGYRQNSSAPADVVTVMDDIRAHIDEIRTFRDVPPIMLREFRARPVAVTKLVLIKLARSWYATDSGRKELPILFIQLGYLLLVGWAGWKSWRAGGINRAFLVSALFLVAYFWGMTFLALSILRYMVPVCGLLFVLFGSCRHLTIRNSKPRLN